MKKIKSFDKFNEKINFKNIAAGAAATITSLTSCSDGRVNDQPYDGYEGDIIVKRIELPEAKYNQFVVSGNDSENQRIYFVTNDLTFNVGDTIHVNFTKGEAYPLNDKENISSLHQP